MKEPQITPELIKKHGIEPSEYEMILKILGREPNFTELGIFSVMWSEHCSYKNSKHLLKTLPTTGKQVLQGPGENAGIIDIGGDNAIVFKIESHNHPSAIEPFQGAATGIGGILRDIFTMGARPIALLDPLRFGNPNNPRTRYIIGGVISGIAEYGNCVGVPTVGGDIYFADSYDGNPLVNVMCVGLIKKDKITRAAAKNKGDLVVYFGSTTGRDGIHGATFASEELSEESKKKRPSVQVGDPFMGKKILEATLELIENNVVSAIQDMGAAGLTCSSCEMASRGGCGVNIDLDKVPKRAEGLSAYEIMLSESQERMLATVPPENIERTRQILNKWELDCCIIGEVTGDCMMRVYYEGELKAEIPAAKIADESPEYTPPSKRPEYVDAIEKFNIQDITYPVDFGATILALLGNPTIASKQWAYTQYDHQVQTNTVVKPGGGAAVLRIKGTDKHICLTTDCNGLFCYLDPYEGTKGAVAEAARNLVISGAKPLGLTNCLNFGNPMKPEIYWQFENCIKGMREACLTFDTPVTGGNVSFYNESYGATAVYPTPLIGMLGLIEDKKHITTVDFKDEGDVIFLVGAETEGLGGSQYVIQFYNKTIGPCPSLDLDFEKRLQDSCLEAIKSGLVKSAQDCSEGGVVVALAESSMLSKKNLGAQVTLPETTRFDEFLFSEAQSRIVVTVSPKNEEAFANLCASNNVPTLKLGTVSGNSLNIAKVCDISVEDMKKSYYAGF